MVNTLYPSLMCEWFLTDLARRVSETARCLFDFVLSPLCFVPAGVRAKTLMKIVSSVPHLYGVRAARSPIIDLLDRLIRQRLDAGLKQGWGDIDADITRLLDTHPMTSLSKAHAIEIFKSLRLDTSGVAGNQPRVRLLVANN